MNPRQDDLEPITDEWLLSICSDETMNGHSVLIDGHGGDPIELYLREDRQNAGTYKASMMQSTPADSIAITGRSFRTRGDVRLLFAALGYQP